MTLLSFINLVATFLAASAAAWAVVRRQHSCASISFGIGMLIFAGAALISPVGPLYPAPHPELLISTLQLSILSLAPAVWLVFGVSYSRAVPNISVRRWLPAIIALALAGLVAGWFFDLDLIRQQPGPATHLGPAGIAVHTLIIIGATFLLMNLEQTFRASAGVTRWQVKYLTVGLLALFLTRIYTSTQSVVYRSTNPDLDLLNSFALGIAGLMAHVSFLRGRPFSVSIHPGETPVHRSIVVALIGAYLLAVGLIANAASVVGGIGAFPLVTLGVLLALVAAGMLSLSDHFRLGIKRAFSRTFGRSVHDFRKVWTAYSERTINAATESDLSRCTVKLISESIDALSVTAWLVRSDATLNFGASTALSDGEAQNLLQTHGGMVPRLESLRALQRPIDIDVSQEEVAAWARELHPVRFRRGGSRLCLPVRAGGELLAIVLIGDRVGDLSPSTEDIDLLTCVADQLGRDLARMRLSHRLTEAKEMQAFQTVATFFIHDLKNTASTLSLMVQNLGIHFDQPEFRQDAIRALNKSVHRINDIVSRLGAVRHELKLKRAPSDISAVVRGVVAEVGNIPGVDISTSLSSTPPIELDSEQMHKVLLNLVLNARDAIHVGGQISIETTQTASEVLLSVRDNGSGMSPDFVRNQLFRPFQTTKTKGLGIGMFQSKMIVEAHAGAITVQSAEGKGTTFCIRLPINGIAS